MGNSSPPERTPLIGTELAHGSGGNPGPAEVAHMFRVPGTEAFGDEAIHALSQYFRISTAEHALRGGVDEDDALVLVDGDDAVHGRVDDALQTLALLLHGRFRLRRGNVLGDAEVVRHLRPPLESESHGPRSSESSRRAERCGIHGQKAG